MPPRRYGTRSAAADAAASASASPSTADIARSAAASASVPAAALAAANAAANATFAAAPAAAAVTAPVGGGRTAPRSRAAKVGRGRRAGRAPRGGGGGAAAAARAPRAAAAATTTTTAAAAAAEPVIAKAEPMEDPLPMRQVTAADRLKALRLWKAQQPARAVFQRDRRARLRSGELRGRLKRTGSDASDWAEELPDTFIDDMVEVARPSGNRSHKGHKGLIVLSSDEDEDEDEYDYEDGEDNGSDLKDFIVDDEDISGDGDDDDLPSYLNYQLSKADDEQLLAVLKKLVGHKLQHHLVSTGKEGAASAASAAQHQRSEPAQSTPERNGKAAALPGPPRKGNAAATKRAAPSRSSVTRKQPRRSIIGTSPGSLATAGRPMVTTTAAQAYPPTIVPRSTAQFVSSMPASDVAAAAAGVWTAQPASICTNQAPALAGTHPAGATSASVATTSTVSPSLGQRMSGVQAHPPVSSVRASLAQRMSGVQVHPPVSSEQAYQPASSVQVYQSPAPAGPPRPGPASASVSTAGTASPGVSQTVSSVQVYQSPAPIGNPPTAPTTSATSPGRPAATTSQPVTSKSASPANASIASLSPTSTGPPPEVEVIDMDSADSWPETQNLPGYHKVVRHMADTRGAGADWSVDRDVDVVMVVKSADATYPRGLETDVRILPFDSKKLRELDLVVSGTSPGNWVPRSKRGMRGRLFGLPPNTYEVMLRPGQAPPTSLGPEVMEYIFICDECGTAFTTVSEIGSNKRRTIRTTPDGKVRGFTREYDWCPKCEASLVSIYELALQEQGAY